MTKIKIILLAVLAPLIIGVWSWMTLHEADNMWLYIQRDSDITVLLWDKPKQNNFSAYKLIYSANNSKPSYNWTNSHLIWWTWDYKYNQISLEKLDEESDILWLEKWYIRICAIYSEYWDNETDQYCSDVKTIDFSELLSDKSSISWFDQLHTQIKQYVRKAENWELDINWYLDKYDQILLKINDYKNKFDDNQKIILKKLILDYQTIILDRLQEELNYDEDNINNFSYEDLVSLKEERLYFFNSYSFIKKSDLNIRDFITRIDDEIDKIGNTVYPQEKWEMDENELYWSNYYDNQSENYINKESIVQDNTDKESVSKNVIDGNLIWQDYSNQFDSRIEDILNYFEDNDLFTFIYENDYFTKLWWVDSNGNQPENIKELWVVVSNIWFEDFQLTHNSSDTSIGVFNDLKDVYDNEIIKDNWSIELDYWYLYDQFIKLWRDEKSLKGHVNNIIDTISRELYWVEWDSILKKKVDQQLIDLFQSNIDNFDVFIENIKVIWWWEEIDRKHRSWDDPGDEEKPEDKEPPVGNTWWTTTMLWMISLWWLITLIVVIVLWFDFIKTKIFKITWRINIKKELEIINKSYQWLKSKLTYTHNLKTIYNNIKNIWYNLDPLFLSNFLASIQTTGFVILLGTNWVWKTAFLESFINSLYKNSINRYYRKIIINEDIDDEKKFLWMYDRLNNNYLDPYWVTKLITTAYFDRKNPYFLILDEINLQSIEKYFPYFLESDKIYDKWESSFIKVWDLSDADSEDLKFRKLELIKEYKFLTESIDWIDYFWFKIPKNLFIVWTANIDKIIEPFTGKILDRSNIIKMKYMWDKNYSNVEYLLEGTEVDFSSEINIIYDEIDPLIRWLAEQLTQKCNISKRTENSLIKYRLLSKNYKKLSISNLINQKILTWAFWEDYRKYLEDLSDVCKEYQWKIDLSKVVKESDELLKDDFINYWRI